jgi:hypothetical protein
MTTSRVASALRADFPVKLGQHPPFPLADVIRAASEANWVLEETEQGLGGETSSPSYPREGSSAASFNTVACGYCATTVAF